MAECHSLYPRVLVNLRIEFSSYSLLQRKDLICRVPGALGDFCVSTPMQNPTKELRYCMYVQGIGVIG